MTVGITTNAVLDYTGIFAGAAHVAARLAIRRLDLEPVKFKLVKEKGWSLQDVDRVAKLYKGFLLLHAVDPGGVHVPTVEIDEMWHAHILDTYKYMEDCQRIFGHYLHHFPYLGLRGEEDKADADEKFAATRARFTTLTGLDILARGADLDAADCGGASCGGSSCSSSSCGGSGDDCPTPASCSGIIPGTTDPSPSRKRDDKKKEDAPPSEDKSIWRRIIPGLNMRAQNAMRTDVRPGRHDLLRLIEGQGTDVPDTTH